MHSDIGASLYTQSVSDRSDNVITNAKFSNCQTYDPAIYNRCIKWLSPWEAALTNLQKLLIWEHKLFSFTFFVAVHLFFWYAAYSSHTVYCIFVYAFLVIVFLDIWRNALWSGIKEKMDFVNVDNNWVVVYPQLLSVHDVAYYFACVWTNLNHMGAYSFQLRQSSPFMFCLLNTFIFVSGAYLGKLLSGVSLLYLCVLCFLMTPALLYYDVYTHIQTRLAPLMEYISSRLEAPEHKLEDPDEASAQEAAMCPPAELIAAELERNLRLTSKRTPELFNTSESYSPASDNEDLSDFLPSELDEDMDLFS